MTIKPSPVVKKPMNQLKALVVDDDPFQLEMVVDLLREIGIHDVKQASSGEGALKLIAEARNAPFNVLLTDLHMPGMDGFNFMAEVAQRGFSGGLIIVSGQTSEVLYSASLVARLRRFNLLGMLTKPVDRAALAALMHPLVL